MNVTEQHREDCNILQPMSKNMFLKVTRFIDPEVEKLLLWNNRGQIQLCISAKGAAPCTS